MIFICIPLYGDQCNHFAWLTVYFNELIALHALIYAIISAFGGIIKILIRLYSSSAVKLNVLILNNNTVKNVNNRESCYANNHKSCYVKPTRLY
jgi:hypothetical protein